MSLLAWFEIRSHAECIALAEAARKLDRWRLDRALMVVTLEPCPMCMGAIYWSRFDKLYFACGVEDTRSVGFDDAFQYEDFAKPLGDRRIPIEQVGRDAGMVAYQAWEDRENKHPY